MCQLSVLTRRLDIRLCLPDNRTMAGIFWHPLNYISRTKIYLCLIGCNCDENAADPDSFCSVRGEVCKVIIITPLHSTPLHTPELQPTPKCLIIFGKLRFSAEFWWGEVRCRSRSMLMTLVEIVTIVIININYFHYLAVSQVTPYTGRIPSRSLFITAVQCPWSDTIQWLQTNQQP